MLTRMEALCYMTSPGLVILAFRSPDTAVLIRVMQESLENPVRPWSLSVHSS